MTKEEIYKIWAPDESVWAQWAKPVLFAHLDVPRPDSPVIEAAEVIDWAPPAGERAAIVLDLPCAQAVPIALALAAQGYRPVPLYNAVPLPTDFSIFHWNIGDMYAAVNVLPILNALRNGAEQLSTVALPPDAPPVFLLDGDRGGWSVTPGPGDFDNRSVSFPTDFPSVNFLSAQGIRRALVVQRDRTAAQPDLGHTLRRWQDGGFVLTHKRLDEPGPPKPLLLPWIDWYKFPFQRVLAAFGFHRAWGGGFGGWMPKASGG